MDEHIIGNEEQSEQHDDDQPDGEQHDVERKAIEEAILSIIGKIKKDRNRACVQNIHTFVNRRGFDIEADIVEKVIDDLISNNMIENKGRNGKESFFIVNMPSDNEGLIHETNNVFEDDADLNALRNLIDDKFYTILVNKIKSEVKLALNDIFNGNTIKEVNDAIIKDGNYKKESNVNDVLIITLREEIKFLHDELKSKDKIVQLIIQEKGNQCNVKKKYNFEDNPNATRMDSNTERNILNKKNEGCR